MRLTVAIPTFARPQALRDNVLRLLPQLTSECSLLVLDNASPVPAVEVLGPIIPPEARGSIRIERNRLNTGASANTLRCFELCDSEWLWILGDDDTICPDAVQVIGRAIERYPEARFVNFSSDICRRAVAKVTRGVSGLVDGMDSWSNVLFLSTSIYRVAVVAPLVRIGYHYAYSGAPHIAALMAALGDSGECCFSEERIIASHSAAEWSPLTVYLGRTALLEMPLAPPVRRSLAQRFRADTKLEFLASYLVRSALAEGEGSEALYFYDQIISRACYYDRSFWTWIRCRLYRLLIRHFRVGSWVIGVMHSVLRLVGRTGRVGPNDLVIRDRFDRQ